MICQPIKKSHLLVLIAITSLFISACNTVTGAVKYDKSISISVIQGSGTKSPFEGKTVSVYGIVTGDFQNNDADVTRNLGGFYIQGTSDDNPATSDGIFIYDNSKDAVDVNYGDLVEISGMVREFYGETQIKVTSVTIIGRGIIKPSDITLPSVSLMQNSRGNKIANLEHYEGMFVHLPQKFTVSSLRFLEQFGEVNLVQGNRTQQFTNNHQPHKEKYSDYLDSLASRSLIFDDGMSSSNPSFIRHLNSGDGKDYSIRVGDSITGITGVLRYSKGSGGRGTDGWRIEPTRKHTFKNDNPRPGAPVVAGTLKVASFNVLNFFSTIDNGTKECKCRGADSEIELKRQLDKTVSALAMMDSDIIGLIELENNKRESIAMIVNALNARIGGQIYSYLDTGMISDDAIKTGFIYKSSTVNTLGKFALLSSTIDPRFEDYRHRPALAQTFEVKDTGAKLTVIVNHLKSKGSSCESSGDINVYDGQGNCNLTRNKAALALIDWIATDPTKSMDKDFLIIGDLNAYTMEDPLTSLKKAEYVNLLDSTVNAYSYNYNNQSGALDHALASPSLVPQIKETIEWHINSDEPKLFDYNLEYGRNPLIFDSSSPYRSSDHDPVIIGLELSQ